MNSTGTPTAMRILLRMVNSVRPPLAHIAGSAPINSALSRRQRVP